VASFLFTQTTAKDFFLSSRCKRFGAQRLGGQSFFRQKKKKDTARGARGY
jgi:hypothetical protein